MIHNIFPVSIWQSEYKQFDVFNELCLKDTLKYVDEKGKTGEDRFNKLHQLPEYEHFYRFVSCQIKKYIEAMGVSTLGMDVNVTKSWFEIKKETTLATHAHWDNHYSFVYVVNNPDEIRKDIFFCHPNIEHHHNEPHFGFFNWSRKEHTYENTLTWTFPSDVGTLYVFPSKIQHGTDGKYDPNCKTSSGIFSYEDACSSRVVIAGDTIISINDDEKSVYNHLGLKNPKEWRCYK